MRTFAATCPGSEAENEDFYLATPDVLVVSDGATIRTGTGCIHGPAWYARTLTSEVILAAEVHDTGLKDALAEAIARTTARHQDTCDTQHPGTPSAAIAVVRQLDERVEYCVLGDVSVAMDTTHGLVVVSDTRVSSTAPEARAKADQYPIGSEEKAAALLEMKRGELAARNHAGGYWIAAADPAAAQHAKSGELPAAELRRLVVATDGATRLVDLFAEMTWETVIDTAERSGPASLLDHVRHLEAADPRGERATRNKKSDDATLIFAALQRSANQGNRQVDKQEARVSTSQRAQAIADVLSRMNHPDVIGDQPMKPREADTPPKPPAEEACSA